MPEVDSLTIEERFTRDLARRQAIINTQYGGDEDAYLEHFFAQFNSPVPVKKTYPRLSDTEARAKRAARKTKRYADPRAFPSFKRAKGKRSEWVFRKADRVIYQQAPTKTWHFCACGKTSTRFIAGQFDSKVWVLLYASQRAQPAFTIPRFTCQRMCIVFRPIAAKSIPFSTFFCPPSFAILTS